MQPSVDQSELKCGLKQRHMTMIALGGVIGAGLFVIASPFAAAGGNLGATGKALVVEPGKAAFVRCLGCTTSGYGKQD